MENIIFGQLLQNLDKEQLLKIVDKEQLYQLLQNLDEEQLLKILDEEHKEQLYNNYLKRNYKKNINFRSFMNYSQLKEKCIILEFNRILNKIISNNCDHNFLQPLFIELNYGHSKYLYQCNKCRYNFAIPVEQNKKF